MAADPCHRPRGELLEESSVVTARIPASCIGLHACSGPGFEAHRTVARSPVERSSSRYRDRVQNQYRLSRRAHCPPNCRKPHIPRRISHSARFSRSRWQTRAFHLPKETARRNERSPGCLIWSKGADCPQWSSNTPHQRSSSWHEGRQTRGVLGKPTSLQLASYLETTDPSYGGLFVGSWPNESHGGSSA